MSSVRFVGHAVLSKRLVGELEEQRLAVEPDRGLLPCKAVLAIQTPVAEADIAELVQRPAKAGGIEDPMQFLGLPMRPLDPTEHLCWAVPTILPIAVRPMDLDVVVRHESV